MVIRIVDQLTEENISQQTLDPNIRDYAEPTKLLSILCQGRNDNYMGNFSWRIATAINNHARNIKTLGIEDEVEILVADWGSERPFYHDLQLSPEAKKLVRYLVVPPNIAQVYDKDSGFAAPQPSNSLARRSHGKYLLFSDSDIFVPLASMAKLINGLRKGAIGQYSFDDTFFWSSKLHIPFDLVRQNPSLKEIDRHIEKHWETYAPENVSKEHFQGCGVCLLMKREMWLESRGWDERLIYWGWNDIDWHKRLEWKYQWEDLTLQGMRMFHLEHYKNRFDDYEKELNRKSNPQVEPTEYCPNSDNWGLGDQVLHFVDGFGQKVDPTTGETETQIYLDMDDIERLQSVDMLVNQNPIFKGLLGRATYIQDPHRIDRTFVQQILDEVQPQAILDVGTALGASSVFLTSVPSAERVVSLSHWDREQFAECEQLPAFIFQQFLVNVMQYQCGTKVYPLWKDIEKGRLELLEKGQKFDLIFLNQDVPEQLKQAYAERWSELLNPGGVLCGDSWFGINEVEPQESTQIAQL